MDWEGILVIAFWVVLILAIAIGRWVHDLVSVQIHRKVYSEKYWEQLHQYIDLEKKHKELSEKFEIAQNEVKEYTEKYQEMCSLYRERGKKLYESENERDEIVRKCNRELQNISIERNRLMSAQCDLNEKIAQFKSNLTAIPYASKTVADIMTLDLKVYEKVLLDEYKYASETKALKIRDIRRDTKERIESLKWAEYQLAYLLNLYPTLQEVIETEFKELEITYEEVKDYDRVRDYLSTEEWKNLSTTEKNQLALDRYVESRKKSKWQIGRDYELFVGYDYSKKGYSVDYFGSYMGLEDLGRDLIIKKGKTTYIVQCKYWSKEKQIHENHIMQLYGSVISYGIENPDEKAKGILVTNISLSDTAKKFADILKIKYTEHKDIGVYPRIKCNIGKDEKGNAIKIYHLPMDMQYDKVKIDKPGELLALTVDEAEKAGFRRAYKWHGEKSE